MMKLGLGSYACAWAAGVAGYAPAEKFTPVNLVERAASLGLRLVQIADNMPLEQCPPEYLRILRSTAESCGVRIELGTRGIGHAHLLRYIELCQYFGADLLRVVLDKGSDEPSAQEAVDRIGAVASDLKSAQVMLAVENHDRFDAPTFAKIAREANVGICLDTVNSFGALEGPAVVIAALAPYVVSLHVKDFTIRRLGHNMGFEITGTPAGQGKLDIPALLAALASRGRFPNAILELWPPLNGTLEETIAKESRWIDDSVRYLRTLITD